MLLYGAGGHAKVIYSMLLSQGLNVTCIFDDNPEKQFLPSAPSPVPYHGNLHPDEPIIISIGDNNLRKKISEKISHKPAVVCHSSASIDASAQIGPGTVVMHQAVLQCNAIVGCHVIINTRVIVEHECILGNFVSLAPGVILCGAVQIGEKTMVGAGSIVAPNIIIGKNCLIAAGTVVTKNIPDGAVVRGNPGRIISYTHNQYANK